ncbi:beta-hexosaminidase subunit alpha [Tribolium castaneum]|uniref:Beta-hexosaminidase n=1 Tax=Tribolium castaneum TaxID=7070 RepID=D6WRR9_TRICA|nr:PREDICTED: beta-hexosaminidase subunit alpha [Tribolium castaneum]EFA07069.1 putative beta-hexosaminidase fdl-like Protein [Tribolium castaneum]|eukprot:XP_008196010.1 PREDICTED: beta-hexosaminidase subunit alpha [Tribolium castaneum]
MRLFIFLSFFFVYTFAIRPGPVIQASKGAVWPKPQQQEVSETYYLIRPHSFTFEAPVNIGCPSFLDDALTRYWTIIATSITSKLEETPEANFWELDDNFLGYLETLTITLLGECPNENILPELHDNENYTLTVDSEGAFLESETIWGVLRGLETFSQLIYAEQDTLMINTTKIVDFPRFPHRGFLLDTSRHFEPVRIILQMLDAMAYNKLNVFHWHITDDHSFPYKSRTYHELSDKGAYHPVSGVYEQSDVMKIIEYARVRGIRVIPEFDTPGHTRSWGVAHPELLTSCFTDNVANGELGPMDPTKDTTYDFINNLFTEIVDVFPDSYFHIGGDEVEFDCWKSNPDVSNFMKQNNFSTYEQLESYFIQHVVDILDNLSSKYLVWEEVFVNGVELPNSTVVHVWKDNGLSTLNNVIKAGKYGLYSSCWYLSVLHSGSDWDAFYKCEPGLLLHTEEEKKLLLGGEACMWGEYVNEFSVIPRVWPRASAVAERLWSDENVVDISDAQIRLEEHACRMNKRGIAAQPPNGPGMCF